MILTSVLHAARHGRCSRISFFTGGLHEHRGREVRGPAATRTRWTTGLWSRGREQRPGTGAPTRTMPRPAIAREVPSDESQDRPSAWGGSLGVLRPRRRCSTRSSGACSSTRLRAADPVADDPDAQNKPVNIKPVPTGSDDARSQGVLRLQHTAPRSDAPGDVHHRPYYWGTMYLSSASCLDRLLLPRLRVVREATHAGRDLYPVEVYNAIITERGGPVDTFNWVLYAVLLSYMAYYTVTNLHVRPVTTRRGEDVTHG